MEPRHNLSNNVKSYRMLQKMTQLEFAEAVGISKSTLQEIEYGKSPNLDTVQCIARHLEVPLSVLLSDSVPPTQLEIISQMIQGFDWFAKCSKAEQEELLEAILSVSRTLSQIKEAHGE